MKKVQKKEKTDGVENGMFKEALKELLRHHEQPVVLAGAGSVPELAARFLVASLQQREANITAGIPGKEGNALQATLPLEEREQMEAAVRYLQNRDFISIRSGRKQVLSPIRPGSGNRKARRRAMRQNPRGEFSQNPQVKSVGSGTGESDVTVDIELDLKPEKFGKLLDKLWADVRSESQEVSEQSSVADEMERCRQLFSTLQRLAGQQLFVQTASGRPVEIPVGEECRVTGWTPDGIDLLFSRKAWAGFIGEVTEEWSLDANASVAETMERLEQILTLDIPLNKAELAKDIALLRGHLNAGNSDLVLDMLREPFVPFPIRSTDEPDEDGKMYDIDDLPPL